MYILNNDYDIRKEICRKLFKMYKTHDFIWCNQSYTTLASSMFKHMRGYLPESQYDAKTREVLDDFYPRALQLCTSEEVLEFVTSLDICKCYPSILINNTESIPLYTINDVVLPYDNNELVPGEYYIDEYEIPMGDNDVRIEAGFYSRRTIKILIEKFNIPKHRSNGRYRHGRHCVVILSRTTCWQSSVYFQSLKQNYSQIPSSEISERGIAGKIVGLYVSQWILFNAFGLQHLLRIGISLLTVIGILQLKMNCTLLEKAK